MKTKDDRLTLNQIKDAGQSVVLILLILGYLFHHLIYYKFAIMALLVNMTVPRIYCPFARLWYGLSYILGAVMSKILMTLVFFGVVTPIAYVKRIMGHDPLNLKRWKEDSQSVFVTRNHQYVAQDLEKPY